jgi:HK97 family phage major capsid protein
MKNSFKILRFLSSMLVIALAFAAVGMPELFGAAGLIMAAPLVLATFETSDDAKQKRSGIYEEMQTLINLRKSEKRQFTEDEQKRYGDLEKDWDALTDHIQQLEKDEKRRDTMTKTSARRTAEEKETAELRKYSFSKVIQTQMEGRNLDGLEAEMHQEAEKEHRDAGIGKAIEGVAVPSVIMRSMTATGQTTVAGDQGGTFIPTELRGLIEALRPRLVLAGLGANFIGGLQGNIDWPTGSAVVASWATETGELSDASPSTGKMTISPKRVGAVAGYSRQLLLQSSPSVEAFILNEFYKAIAQAVEQVAIVGGGSNQPKGILTAADVASVAGGTNGAALSYANVVALETAVAQLNADLGSLGYLTNSKVRGKAKTTLKDANVSGHIWEPGNTMNGYNVGVTNLVPSNLTKGSGENLSAAIFGNFNDLIVGNWGGLDIVVDPYSQKKKAQIEVVVNSFWDTLVVRKESFAKITDIITV